MTYIHEYENLKKTPNKPNLITRLQNVSIIHSGVIGYWWHVTAENNVLILKPFIRNWFEKKK